MEKEFAWEFAKDWVDSWNCHDIDRILEHYTDDFEMNSPVIVLRMKIPSGSLSGKEAIREYWSKALEAYSTLKFELQSVFMGVNSLTIQYFSSISGRVVETFLFNNELKVYAAYAMYE